ncbi:hypothetical protein ABKN59_001752 [Abortiporus biennis]
MMSTPTEHSPSNAASDMSQQNLENEHQISLRKEIDELQPISSELEERYRNVEKCLLDVPIETLCVEARSSLKDLVEHWQKSQKAYLDQRKRSVELAESIVASCNIFLSFCESELAKPDTSPDRKQSMIENYKKSWNEHRTASQNLAAEFRGLRMEMVDFSYMRKEVFDTERTYSDNVESIKAELKTMQQSFDELKAETTSIITELNIISSSADDDTSASKSLSLIMLKESLDKVDHGSDAFEKLSNAIERWEELNTQISQKEANLAEKQNLFDSFDKLGESVEKTWDDLLAIYQKTPSFSNVWILFGSDIQEILYTLSISLDAMTSDLLQDRLENIVVLCGDLVSVLRYYLHKLSTIAKPQPEP